MEVYSTLGFLQAALIDYTILYFLQVMRRPTFITITIKIQAYKNLSKDVPWVIMRFDVVIDGDKTAIQLSGNTEYDGGWFKAELSDDYKWIKVSVDNSMAAKQYNITIRMGLYSMDMGPYVNLTVKKKE